MSTKQKVKWILPVVIVVSLFMAAVFYPLLAATTITPDRNDDVAADVNPECVNFHYNSSSGPASAFPLNVTLPFKPGWVKLHANSTASVTGSVTAPVYEWNANLADNAAFVHTNGSAYIAPSHTTGTTVWTISEKTIAIPTGMVKSGEPAVGRACR